MEYIVTALSHEHLDKVLRQVKHDVDERELRLAYFSPGSVSYCLLADETPVLAGGIVNTGWHRGEAWMIPTPFFFSHVKDCYKRMKYVIPMMAKEGKFKRVQSTCSIMVSTILFSHLGFNYEGTMKFWGRNGETCYMYARIF